MEVFIYLIISSPGYLNYVADLRSFYLNIFIETMACNRDIFVCLKINVITLNPGAF